MNSLQQAHKTDLGVIFGLNGFTFAWGCRGMDWIVLTWFLTLLIYLANALQSTSPTSGFPIPNLIYQLDTRNVMWVHFSFVLQDKSCSFIATIWREEVDKPSTKKWDQQVTFHFLGVFCLFWRKMDLGWETKPQNTYWIIFCRWQSCSDKGKDKLLAGKMQVTWKHWLYPSHIFIWLPVMNWPKPWKDLFHLSTERKPVSF